MRVRGASGRYDWTSFSMVFETEPEPPIQSDDSAFYEILVEITKVFRLTSLKSCAECGVMRGGLLMCS